MRERGDVHVQHEPFMYHYYLTAKDHMFPGFLPEPDHPKTYAGIRDMLLSKSRDRAVFFKDMAYYVIDDLPKDPQFSLQMTHAFLIRDPAEAALSYAKLDQSYTCAELGHEAQYRLYRALVDQGLDPLILTADQLRHSPKETLRRYWTHVGLNFINHAFSWNDKMPSGWQSVSSWHLNALNSGAILLPKGVNPMPQLTQYGDHFVDYVSHHMPFYQKLLEMAHKQAAETKD